MNIEEQIDILSKSITAARYGKMLRALEFRTRKLTVVLEDIYQPHNAAAALRNCDAFGLQESTFIENKYLSRISDDVDMGVSKWLDIHRFISAQAQVSKVGISKKGGVSDIEKDNTRHALTHLKACGYALVASSLAEESCQIDDIPVERPLALMVGTELTGLTSVALDMADYVFKIPMLGFAQSFNLSVFTALSLSNLSTRMRAKDDSWKIAGADKSELLLKWLKISVSNSEEILANAKRLER